MHTEVINTDTIYGAVNRILKELKEDYDDATSTARRATGSVWHNVIYFDGWDGLGASAVLRAIGERLNAGPEFSQIIHIDCSKWESRRAVQRALTVQLKLPAHVIGVLDAQDEEDDSRGVGQGSRREIPKVSREIYEHVQKQLGQRFLVIFNNGSCEEIDLESFGFPLSGYSRNKALWSFQGGFRLYPRMKVEAALKSTTASSTGVFLSATSAMNLGEYSFSNILRHEAEEVAKGMISTGSGDIDWPTAAADCFLYTMRLCGMGGHLIDYDLATHGCNYWICDGIIKLQQGQGDVVASDDDAAAAEKLWLSCDALKREMRLDADYHQSLQLPASSSPVVRRLLRRMAYWTSPAYGSTLIKDQSGLVPKGMFQQYDKLCVLKLSACTFSLRYPPFLCCHNLRFLWLDHCQEKSSSVDDGVVNEEEDIRRCFQKLWVLDVRYSSSKFLSEKMMDFMAQLRELHVMGQEEFDMDMLQGRLHNIRKLRVTKSKTNCSKRAYLLSGKDKMEHLELSENGGSMKSLSVESSSCSGLETVIIDGCVSLAEVSLRGWAKPDNLLLSGSFPDLHSIDLTGAAVKILDLSAVMAPKLDELLLLDCVNLTAILLPKAEAAAAAAEGKGTGKRYLGKLRIDTTQKLEEDDDTGSSRSHAGYSWYICVKDARLLRSLEPVKDYFGDNDVHLDISSTTRTMPSSWDADSAIVPTTCPPSRSHAGYSWYTPICVKDARLLRLLEPVKDYFGDNDVHLNISSTTRTMPSSWDADSAIVPTTCPPAPGVSSRGCYMHIEDATAAAAAGNTKITIPGFSCDGVKILHVHDSLFVTRIAASESKWNKLVWCRVERCPKLEYVFSGTDDQDAFGNLKTIWVANLANALYILDLPISKRYSWTSPLFSGLTSLHLYWCPRLAHAIPWTLHNTFQRLETLEIMWCGDLNLVFKPSRLPELPFHVLQRMRFVLPKLKHLRLHELPKLHGMVCFWQSPWPPVKRIYAPNLETVKIRGCWSLRTLPVVEGNTVVSCNCEKEWWDNLQWDSGVHKKNYKPIHSRHYKETMIRGSSLR